MEITPEIEKKLRSYDFRYAECIEGSVYKISDAKDVFDNPTNPHVLNSEKMCFWDHECSEGPKCIRLKNVLIF